MIKKLLTFLRGLKKINITLGYIQESLGRIESRQIKFDKDLHVRDSEFKVYSQSGEDGIIQYLIDRVNIKNKIFIEFGVENYLESNTRFLALNNYWSGLIIDGDINNINFIKQDPIYWRCNIKAEYSFITKDNINDIISRSGISGEIGLLSIDIDGNDYWVFEAINSINPAIIIAEYNSFFGSERPVTIPYDDDFVRTNAHFSHIYYGASITALTMLANKKGYRLVASNKAGNNVFYVREDLMSNLEEITIKQAYRPINFREAHDQSGKLVFIPFHLAKELISDLKVYDIIKEENISIKDLA